MQSGEVCEDSADRRNVCISYDLQVQTHLPGATPELDAK